MGIPGRDYNVRRGRSVDCRVNGGLVIGGDWLDEY
jgi:hypothetical protein